MEHMVDAFYVRATSLVDNAPVPVDVAKFFTRADAEAHVRRLHRTAATREVDIDVRTEPMRLQHPAHRPEA
jgi:hypothetical protein